MNKLLVFNLLMLLSLFYAGLHLLVEERNYLNGFYPESFEEAGFYYNIWTCVCALAGMFVAASIRKIYPKRALLLFLLSALIVCYAAFLFMQGAAIRVESMLAWTGNYIILATLLNFFILMQRFRYEKIA